MTEWKRHGVIFEGVNGRAQCPVVDTNNEDFWRKNGIFLRKMEIFFP